MISNIFTKNDETTHTYVIAEAGLNHNGSVTIAKQLIDLAVEAGADAVKFQKRTVDKLAVKATLDAPDDRFPEFGKTYRESIREDNIIDKTPSPNTTWETLFEYCLLKTPPLRSKKNNLQFLLFLIASSINCNKTLFPPPIFIEGITMAYELLLKYIVFDSLP